ncbi:MAG: helix-turn-helix domain-containing protein [Deltaproteobacteria bacterium]|nr:helix-turn-helix domain-containing protein [Deltaproteobacteria bacterium]MBW2395146.1 helix-turn-helix domain-containing protein [Deltaproteobacteria bacterium]
MELDEVVALTRIPRRSLERLEGGAFDGLSDGFVRGFVRTVAVAIGLDPDETVARLLAEPEIGPRRRWPRVRALIGIAAGISLLAAVAAVVLVSLRSSGPAAEPVEASERVAKKPGLLRRDPVRRLAEEQRALRQD